LACSFVDKPVPVREISSSVSLISMLMRLVNRSPRWLGILLAWIGVARPPVWWSSFGAPVKPWLYPAKGDRVDVERGVAGAPPTPVFTYSRGLSSLNAPWCRSAGWGALQVVDEMLRAGLVAREPHPDDGRSTFAALTPAARAALHCDTDVRRRGAA
jgi:hypothetical protein